ncbi:hypothetical protein L202_05839 [Cryptococcus amylolentus CBS 6039]|uniref:DUF7704 domain-containing protein n=1 Tax=Cryptococcus amylolentus CBS 6039 TaxID=1295533 RepID=A0A1E3HJE6_9TREE|nr:hypothetical protein L202_05839 [Cryptococcus amylolentus CBS 6039]ODN75846.1 hypothetical protein L202_05839 [Cryptococcus amylolentus CBS 6039]
MSSRSSVLPGAYYYFFWLIEPLLTVAGGVSAIYDPVAFAKDSLPLNIERASALVGKSVRGQLVTTQLGSCFLLLAMISFSLFWVIKKNFKDQPAVQEKLVKALLIPLSIADLVHIGITLLALPVSHLQDPSAWTYVLKGNVWITSVLFLVRSAWLLGIARPTASSIHDSALSPHKQARLPLPKTVSEYAVEQVVEIDSKPSEREAIPKAVETPTSAKRRTPRSKKIVQDD